MKRLLNIPILATDDSFELAKDGTFRFADKKPIAIKKFRQYRKRKEVSQMRKEIVH